MLEEKNIATTSEESQEIKKRVSLSPPTCSDHSKEKEKEKEMEMGREVMNGGRREKMRRLSAEMARQVCIPDNWGQENKLEDWGDCTGFTGAYMPDGLALAQEALKEKKKSRKITAFVQLKNRSC